MTDDDLHALQQRFQDYLTGKSEDFEKDIVSTENALAEHRLGAYYNAYRIRLIDSLANDFTGLQKELGEADFEYLVLDYLKLYPSEHPSIRWVGKHMIEFLQHSKYEDKEFLTELALFEWTKDLCFDAENSEQLFKLNDMAIIPAENWPLVTLQFHPSVRWIESKWNTPPYWVALEENKQLPEKKQQDIATRWLMWRKDMSPYWRSLEVSEAWAIEAAMNGSSFAELCEGLLEWIGEESVAMTAAGFLKQWIHDELITQVDVNSD